MAELEGAIVRERYEKHLASIETKSQGLSSHLVMLMPPPVR